VETLDRFAQVDNFATVGRFVLQKIEGTMHHTKSFDIIGDIHGHAAELQALLHSLGYEQQGGRYRHADRKVIFVGDFVDRGTEIAQVIRIAKQMVDAGDALAVMGNHEYNLIAFHTLRPGKQEAWFREHSDKNLHQNEASRVQLKDQALADALAWFKTLPVAIEVGGIRVAHASWQSQDIACIEAALESAGRFTPAFFMLAEDPNSRLGEGVERVLKGPEVRLPEGHWFTGKTGQRRHAVRVKWYEEGAGRTYREHHFGSDDVPDVALDLRELASVEKYPPDAPPLFVGHYWLTGIPSPLATNVACTDYSVAKNGKLVAYRWDGESTLCGEKFHWVGKANAGS